MDAYESIDPESAGSGVYEPKKYFMKDGGGVDDVKSFVATKEGIIEIYSGSDARSAEVKIGDTFIVTEEMKNGIYYLGKLNIKVSFKLSAGLSGKDVNKINFGKQDEILYLLRKENIGGNSNFFAQFKNNNKMKNGGDIHDLYQIIIYNRFGDEMHSYIIGDYEKAMENLKEDLKLAETGSRVDISHNGKVIYSETKKQYKNGGKFGDFKDDGHGNYTNAEGYSLINQFDGTYQVLDADGMEIVGEYLTLKDGKQAIKDYMEENEKYSKGGGVDKERLDAILERRTEINNYLNKKYGRSRGKNKAEKDEIDALSKEYRKLGEEFLELNGGYNEYANGGGVGDEMFSNELHDQYEESYVPIDLEKEIILPNGVTALWIEDNNGKVNIWKKGFGDLASAESWRKITKEKLLDEAVKEYDVKNERLRTTGKTYKTSQSTYAKGGGVGMAMEGMFLDDEFERMVEKLKNYLAKYPYIWTRGTKRYVPIEGWQYAAALMGLSSRVKNVNEIQPGVWQAEADVVDKRSGVVNCSGFAIVNKAEHKWAKKDEDIINFVQTRAVSRALRNCISYLIKAAGYSSTPAEEMYGLASEENKKKGMPSSIKPVKGVSEDDFIFDRPEYNEGMTQPPFPKEDVPITKYVPREEIPQEDMLRKVWAESKANGIVIRSAEFMNEIELALTDETIGTETQIKSLLMESYNWLTENGIVLRSKIFMKKFKDSL